MRKHSLLVLSVIFALLVSGSPILKKSYVVPSLTTSITQEHGQGTYEVDSVEPIVDAISNVDIAPTFIPIRMIEGIFVASIFHLALQLLQSLVISLPPPGQRHGYLIY